MCVGAALNGVGQCTDSVGVVGGVMGERIRTRYEGKRVVCAARRRHNIGQSVSTTRRAGVKAVKNHHHPPTEIP